MPAPQMDGPMYAPGLDCDGDGGVVQYVTPSNFKVALRRLFFIKDDGSEIDIVSDTGTLSTAQVYDLTSEVILPSQSVSPGNYPAAKAAFYYFEITMAINDPPAPQAIRVYLSDDDFPQEGNLGHHQGDVTLVDSSGNELGWVSPAAPWTRDNLSSFRPNFSGAGGADPETGHLRGLYGNGALWNQPAFMQGSNQDTFLVTSPLNLAVAATDRSITFAFDLKDCWFYEDFDNDQTFDPCLNTSDACAPNAEWTPILNPPSVTVD